MPLFRPLLPGFLLLAGTTASVGQTAFPSVLLATAAPADNAPPKLLLKVGLNAARVLRPGSYYGLLHGLPVSVAAEYALRSKVTVYGQLDTDVALHSRPVLFGERNPLIPTGALSLGARYYYNQTGGASHNPAHGPFLGNYLAVGAHTEMVQYFTYQGPPARLPAAASRTLHTAYIPTLNLLWGTQRRLGHNFLLDFNAGVGLGANRRSRYTSAYLPSSINPSVQVNLGIYFGR